VSERKTINILVTLNENYIPYLNVMLTSLVFQNQGCRFDVYLLHSSIKASALSETKKILEGYGRLIPVQAKDIGLENAPITARYPKEMYYRIFAARYLPETLDRVLYLDPDIIVNGSVKELYDLSMEGNYFAAATHNGSFMHKVNEVRLDMEPESLYINSGVMLMNLKLLREEQDYAEVFAFIEKRRNLLILPDQDIISGLYGNRILELDTFRYNMTETLYQLHTPLDRELNLDWVRRHSVIIHYCGRNKPWKDAYIGQLDIFYKETVKRMKLRMR